MADQKSSLNQYRQQDLVALRRALTEARITLQKTRVDLAFGRLSKPSELSHQRKLIAQLATLIKEKETTHD